MVNQEFLKKIYELKLQYQNIPWKDSLQLQTLLRKNMDNSNIVLLVTEFILNEKKYEKKFPKLINSGGLIKGVVCEQATDEQIAEHKASFFKGNQFLDLTAGLAIDTMAFAKNFFNVTAIETNPDLIPLLLFNSEKLNLKNIHFIHDTAENFLSYNQKKWDLVYIDPSRKVEQKKVYHPKDCSPNIFKILPQLYSITDTILIKLSPMLEIQEVLKWFENIEYLWVISKNQECKEILVLINPKHNSTPYYRLSILNKEQIFVYEFEHIDNFIINQDLHLEDYSWVLIPDVVFVKSHTLTNLQNLTQGFLTDTHDGILLLSQKPKNYYGKIKKIKKILQLKEFEVYLKNSSLNKAQVIKKHFPMKVEEIRKKWKILEGTFDTLIFLKMGGHTYVIHCVEDDLII